MKTKLFTTLYRLCTPGDVPEGVVVFWSLIAIVVLTVLDVLTGATIELDPFYIFPLAAVGYHCVKDKYVIGAIVFSIALQGAVLLTADAVIGDYKALNFFIVVLSNVGFTVGVRVWRNRVLRARWIIGRDLLTKLYNRQTFEDALSTELTRSQCCGGCFTVALIDIDGFDGLNDTKGEAEADRALKIVADILRRQSRETDTVARFGWCDFVILMPHTYGNNCHIHCEDICHDIGVKLSACFLLPLTASVSYMTIGSTDPAQNGCLNANGYRS